MRETTLHRTTLVLAALFVVVAAVFGVLRNSINPPRSEQGRQALLGAELFREKGCSDCHAAESTRTKVGPGLKGLFDREKLPVSGSPVSEENIRKQLEDPYENMPSFADSLTEQERDRIIAYLKTL
ncbi:MAG: c-type cytochrome [Desulfohalobiaceae bacterium]|nr:c-type cytochrome [Desulfohalobiaceae bacterium]